MEVLPWAYPPIWRDKGQRCLFQSLFWWKYCPGLVTAVNRTTRFRFNPCSGGSIALGQKDANPAVFLTQKFQSLFWWKYCPGVDRQGAAVVTLRDAVSILVLVEVLPWAWCGSRCPLDSHKCFNPCSGGSIALGADAPTGYGQPVFVSILVLVEVLPWGWQRHAGRCTSFEVSILVLVEVLPWAKITGPTSASLRKGFNPCSGGSIALGSRAARWTTRHFTSFNPCSGGSIALGTEYAWHGGEAQMFQSLFWWKYCPGQGRQSMMRSELLCFNPCSGGSIALGLLGRTVGLHLFRFQSLFWWKYCPGLW